MEELVRWENTTNEDVLEKAREEIRRSWREVCELNKDHSQARVDVRLEIQAEFPDGVSDQIKRAVSENANQLDFTNKTWE